MKVLLCWLFHWWREVFKPLKNWLFVISGVLTAFFSPLAFSEEMKFLTFPLAQQATIGNAWQYGMQSDTTRSNTHFAIDYYVQEGTDVIASADGYAMYDCQDTCDNSSKDYGYGRVIFIKHDEQNHSKENLYTLYAHLSESEQFIPKKDRNAIKSTMGSDGILKSFDAEKAGWVKIKRGQKIGESGKSGGQSWPHLHFAVFADSYSSVCHPESNGCNKKSYDPYDLYKITKDEDSSNYYPPIFYLSRQEVSTTLTYSGRTIKRESGAKYTSSGNNRLWISDPPYLPIFISQTTPKISRQFTLGVNDGCPGQLSGICAGKFVGSVILHEYNPLMLTDSQIMSNQQGVTSMPASFDKTSRTMKINLLNEITYPVRIELFSENNLKLSEIWYPFADIEANHFAAKSIIEMWKNGIITGYDKGNYLLFKPQDKVRRSEFLKMVMLAAGRLILSPTKTSFKDVPFDHWALGYIESAKESGIIEGFKDGTFKPDDVIARVAAAKIAAITFGFMSENTFMQMFLDKTSSSMSSNLLQCPNFIDIIQNQWYCPYITQLESIGVMKGYKDGTFKPKDEMTRAEAVTVICRAYSYNKQGNTALCD